MKFRILVTDQPQILCRWAGHGVFYGLTARKPSFFRFQIFRNTYGSVLSDQQNWQILLEKFSLAGEPVLS